MATREERLQRARELHVRNPQWGRRRIAAQLRAEFGRSLRDSVIDSITRPYRESIKAGLPPKPEVPYIPGKDLPSIMAQTGFLPFEIVGVKGSPAKGLGEVAPDAQHPIFRQVIKLMIEYRRREYDFYTYRMRGKGYGEAQIQVLWRKRIMRYYNNGNFPMIGGPSPMGGGFISSNGDPSPWAVYKAAEAKLFKGAPVGGDGWGTDRPAVSKKVKKPERTADKIKLRDEVIKIQKQINELSDKISMAKTVGNRRQVMILDRQRSQLINTRNKLSEGL